jgi:catechol 2,3-dioxygenase-like lactoylglutathione lyase family enzyme
MVKTRVDHLTFAVRDGEKTWSFVENVLGGRRLFILDMGGGTAVVFNIGDKLPVLVFFWAPTEGEGMFPDFLRNKGEGLHHMGFQVDNLNNFKQTMVAYGIKIPQWELEGNQTIRDEVLIGTRHAPAVLQMLKFKRNPTNVQEWDAIEREYTPDKIRETEEVKDLKPQEAKIIGVDHITFAVKDREKTFSLVEDVLGGKYLFTIKMEDTLVSSFSFGDELPVFGFTWAPMEGEGVIADYLKKKGEGLHHIGLQVDNLDRFKRVLETNGIEILQRKLNGDMTVRNQVHIDTRYMPTGLQVIQYKQALTKVGEWVQVQKDLYKGKISEESWKEVML